NGLWHLSGRRGTQSGHSKTNSFYYGSETNGTYNTGTANRGTLSLPPVSLVGVGGRATLTFKHLLQRENSEPSKFDVAKVEVSDNGGATFDLLAGPFSNTTNQFQAVFADLTPYLNKQVIIRFSFDTGDSHDNNFEGWYVDDIAVKAFSCP